MRIIVPDYYKEFHCIADKCKHTCCKGWEVEIDEESLNRFENCPDIMEKVEFDGGAHFRLSEDEVCPFLKENGLCEMIIRYGEDMICQTCTDHPRFRNYWSDRIEMGLGLVCEEAARLILGREKPMRLEVLENGPTEDHVRDDDLPEGSFIKNVPSEEESQDDELSVDDLPEDEQWLMDLRNKMLKEVAVSGMEGPIARLKEYLIYRHIPDALYDDRLEERTAFVEKMTEEISNKWADADGGFDSLLEIVRVFSYDVEYDEEVKEEYLQKIAFDISVRK